MAQRTMPDLAAAMRAAVRGLVDRLDTEQRRQLVFLFDGDMHKRWTYLPGQRPGLRLGDLSDEQLEPALDLLQLVHSVRSWCSGSKLSGESCRSSRPAELALIRTGTCRTGWWCWEIRRAPIPGPGGSTATTCWRRPRWSAIRSTAYRTSAVRSRPRCWRARTPACAPCRWEEYLARELMLALQEDQRRM